jgi:hypothetical protein
MTLTLGADVGYGYTKVFSSTGCALTFPSVVGRAEARRFRTDLTQAAHAGQNGSPHEGGHVCLNGTAYCYGAEALRYARLAVQPRDRHWITSLPYRVLWEAVLEATVPPSATPVIVTGLPVSEYADRERLEEVVRDALTSKGISQATVRVVPQPFGSFCDWLLAEDGTLHDATLINSHVGVIDIGHYTTDFAEIAALEYIQRGSGSIPVGVATVLDALSRHVYDTWGRRLDMHEAATMLTERRVRIRGSEHDLSPVCDAALQETSLAILTTAQQLWGGAEAFDCLLASGGGAPAFQQSLTARFPHLTVLPGSFTANARGYRKYGALVSEHHAS